MSRRRELSVCIGHSLPQQYVNCFYVRSCTVMQAMQIELSPTTLMDGLKCLARCDPDLASILKEFGAPPLWFREPGFANPGSRNQSGGGPNSLRMEARSGSQRARHFRPSINVVGDSAICIACMTVQLLT